jgi:YfiH family protein
MARTLFTNRSGGVSAPPFDSNNLALHVGDDSDAVFENRNAIAAQIGIPAGRVFYMNQVHGREISIVTAASRSESTPTADGLFTLDREVALVSLVADCVPLLLYSKEAIAALHVGRKGLVAGVVEAALEVFEKFGISLTDLSAEIGPSICVDCYQVDLKSYRQVVAQEPSAGSNEVRRCIDVRSGISAKLKRIGASVKNSKICVAHTPGYFSFRRDGQTGRQAGIIWLP